VKFLFTLYSKSAIILSFDLALRFLYWASPTMVMMYFSNGRSR